MEKKYMYTAGDTAGWIRSIIHSNNVELASIEAREKQINDTTLRLIQLYKKGTFINPSVFARVLCVLLGTIDQTVYIVVSGSYHKDDDAGHYYYMILVPASDYAEGKTYLDYDKKITIYNVSYLTVISLITGGPAPKDVIIPHIAYDRYYGDDSTVSCKFTKTTHEPFIGLQFPGGCEYVPIQETKFKKAIIGFLDCVVNEQIDSDTHLSEVEMLSMLNKYLSTAAEKYRKVREPK